MPSPSIFRRALLAFGFTLACAPAASAAPMLVYIGTYTQTTSRGIYVLRFDPSDGSLSQPELAAESRNPTFLVLDPDKIHLYSAGDSGAIEAPGPVPGAVTAYAIDRATGRLQLLNQRLTGRGGATHLVVDATDRMLVTVSYSGGTVMALPIAGDGSLGAIATTIEHQGPLGPNKDRQNTVHPHSVTLSPDNRFAFVCDLGQDRVYSYRVDPARAGLAPNDPPFAESPPGTGPRHTAFSLDGRFLYDLNEMGSSICVFAYERDRGSLELKQTVPTLPEDFHGLNTSAEIRISPDGRFVYASNRGHDSLAVFAADPDSGTLALVQRVSCGGKHPRNFTLTPDGRWLLCANRDTNNIVAFRVDPDTGRLTQMGSVPVPMPVCVLFCD